MRSSALNTGNDPLHLPRPGQQRRGQRTQKRNQSQDNTDMVGTVQVTAKPRIAQVPFSSIDQLCGDLAGGLRCAGNLSDGNLGAKGSHDQACSAS
jgi:hypothetical protein